MHKRLNAQVMFLASNYCNNKIRPKHLSDDPDKRPYKKGIMHKRLLSLLGLVMLGVNIVNSQSSRRVEEYLLSDPSLKSAQISFSLVDLATGEEVDFYNSSTGMVPASTLKLLTTASVLKELGPDFTMMTTVGYNGQITSDGVLKGNLIIKGSGDPTLGSKYSANASQDFFNKILHGLKALGVNSIEGSILVDDSDLGFQPVPSAWTWEDMGNYYAAGVFGVNYQDNMYEITLNTSKKGKRPTVMGLSPKVEGLDIVNGLESYATSYDSAYIYGAPYCARRSIYGAVPQTSATFKIKGDIPDPAIHLAKQLKSFLSPILKLNVDCITARMLIENSEPVSQVQNTILLYKGDRLRDVITTTNRYSNNLYAEALLRQLALKNGGKTTAEGVKSMMALWDDLGMNTKSVLVKDGSGLSPLNRMTAQFMSKVLYIMKDDWIFKQSIPVVGKEGTVRTFMSNGKWSGAARIKSGSMGQVLCYAGYLLDRYAVVVMVNNAEVSNSYVRKSVEKMLNNI